MEANKRIRFIGLLAVGLLLAVGAEDRKSNITSADARRTVGEVAAFQQFPADYRLARMGSIRGGEAFFHIFTTWLKDTGKWRTLVFENSGAYLGYYETSNEPAELEKSGITYPGHSYSAESGDNAEGEFDSGDSHTIVFSTNGPPDLVKFEEKTFTFVSSPKRIRPDTPGYRFVLVANRMADSINQGRYLRIRDDFSARALAKLSEERTKTAFANLRQRLGKIERLDAPWVQQESIAVFPVSFEKGVVGLELSLDADDKISGLRILPFTTAFPELPPHQTALTLPYGGRWRVMWGGDNRQTSKYFGNRVRQHAREFVIADRYGLTYLEEGKKNADFFAFGRPVVAPAAGEVIAVVNGVEDNRPRSPNTFAGLGNMVVIQHATNEVSVIGHLMNDSILVKTGQVVAVRQPIARCGNSGDSTQPSIYYHLQDNPAPDTGSGYRPQFRNVLIWDRGRGRVDAKHSPSRGEYVEQHSAP
ncbi:hypothetical protein PDESU_06533 [Pontiella desulfatans]|uniref:Peptidase M23 domain-containing protein n=1 Tax=Pontiella desulfatans TaxID=2750659 RepID=A0A6C2UET5_PONDE|nr:peptidoglycan DD-metalloendopeptidase family protein [Pontiella desulfatans]VGO17931.1 hypothetical protein PDESU_06533 [Pontiella desulfatans]